MKVRSSHLALRFYAHDGWDRKTLEKCLERGGLYENYPSNYHYHYYSLSPGSKFNIQRLMQYITSVDRYYKGPVKETDEEYIRQMNW